MSTVNMASMKGMIFLILLIGIATAIPRKYAFLERRDWNDAQYGPPLRNYEIKKVESGEPLQRAICYFSCKASKEYHCDEICGYDIPPGL